MRGGYLKGPVMLCVAAGTLLAAQPGAAQSAIEWEPYVLRGPGEVRDTARLGTLRVPARHGAEESDSIGVAFVMLPAHNGSTAPPLIYLDGGPGGSGVAAAGSESFYRVFDEARARRDVILLAQRGTRLASPFLACQLAGPLAEDVFRTRSDLLDALEPSLHPCVETWTARGVDLGSFNTWESAADVDAVRRALGSETVVLFGFSYGTHLALTYMSRYPEQLDRVVLVGTEGLGHTYKLPSTFDRQVRHLSALYGAAEGLPAERLDRDLKRLLDRLDREPLTVPVRSASGDAVAVAVGGDGLRYFLRRDLGDTRDLPMLATLVRQTLEGDHRLLSALTERRYQEISGVPLMSLLMDCASGATSQRMATIEADSAGTLLGAMTNSYFPEVCQSLPAADIPLPRRSPPFTTRPVLFVSGAMDANTPPFQAEEVRWGLPAAAHLVVENAGHEDMLTAPGVAEAVLAFLAGEDISSRRAALPPIRFR